jgi:lipopolysaccharide export system protein LptC
VSERARSLRRDRRAWAAAGSSHDRLIALLRVALPVAVCVLAAFLALAPLTVGRDISFVLSKDRVEVSKERMRVSQATYRGEDSRGEPFRLDADSGVQQTSRDPILRLSGLRAELGQRRGPTRIIAQKGRYDLDSQRLAIDGPTQVDGADGFRLATADVLVDLNQRAMVSRRPVTGTMSLGTFAADRLLARFDSGVVTLDGGARLHIVQGRARGAR